MNKLILIDGNSLLNRAYFALPALNDEQGRNVNAVFGFVKLLIKVLNDYKPTNLVVTFDKHGHNFRKDLYADYKGNRKGMPEDLALQMPILHDLLALMQVNVVEQAGIEADDLIGTFAKHSNAENLIVTGDRDLLQLVDDNTTVLLTKKGISEVETVTVDYLKDVYHMTPSQVVEFKALRGDTSDNIPGVRGIGDKTASMLIEKYGDVDGVYAHLNEQKGALAEKLASDKEMAYVSKQLATIVTDVDIDVDISKCGLPVFNQAVKTELDKLKFRSIVSSLSFDQEIGGGTVEEFHAESIAVDTLHTLKKVVEELLLKSSVAVCFDGDKIYLSSDEAKEYVVTVSDRFIDELSEAVVLDVITPLLECDLPSKRVFDGKTLRHYLDGQQISFGKVDYDLALMQYVTDYRSSKTLDEMLSANGMGNFKGAGLFRLCETYRTKLAELNLDKLYYDVELPLSLVLYQMEKQGVAVDEKALDGLSEYFANEIDGLTKQIYDLAGEEFNVASPVQLGKILFEKLGLKHFKKTQKGYSTSSDVLEKLIDQHPIVELVMKYRTVTKLQGTYVEGIRPLIKSGKVHTTYNQFLTTTGRLSSSDPNLQNIPVHNDLGKEIRKLFVSQNGVFVGADYSQIELRLLAAFSKDENLSRYFAEGKDIHRKVASEIMSVPEEMVNDNMRRMAKAVNFGIVYGISSFGLSENVGISVAKAGEYIKKYFERFPTIKTYLDGSVALAKKQGYVTTFTGRRRYIPEINSANFNLRSFGERASMNMPLQGSAADVMKIAMLKVDKALKERGLKSKAVMQIHDELIVDTFPDEVEQVEGILKTEMENAVDVGVKLTVELEKGASLYEV